MDFVESLIRNIEHPLFLPSPSPRLGRTTTHDARRRNRNDEQADYVLLDSTSGVAPGREARRRRLRSRPGVVDHDTDDIMQGF